MSTYPPTARAVVEKKCANEECSEFDVMQELPAWEETGRLFLHREDELYCRECGEGMIDP